MPKKQNRKLSVSAYVNEQLEAIGAAHIPPTARRAIDDDLDEVIHALIKKRVTGEYVGRMVALGLAQPEGSKEDGTSSLPSQSHGTTRPSEKYHGMLAGPAINPLMAHDGEGEARRPQSHEQGGVS